MTEPALERLVSRVDPDVLLIIKVVKYFISRRLTFRWCLNLKALPQSEHLKRRRTEDSSLATTLRWVWCS